MKIRNVKARMTSKGQLTIPKTIRTLLKVEEGDFIQFLIESNRIYIQKAVSECPVCLGKGMVMEQPCFFCLESGELMDSFDPFNYQSIWFVRYGINSDLTLNSTNGVVSPSIEIKSNRYSEEILMIVQDAILLTLYKNGQLSEEHLPPTFKTGQIQKFWNKYLG
ncbi:MAG: hypothetical protein ABS939_00055 [Psychrobacillus sp.]